MGFLGGVEVGSLVKSRDLSSAMRKSPVDVYVNIYKYVYIYTYIYIYTYSESFRDDSDKEKFNNKPLPGWTHGGYAKVMGWLSVVDFDLFSHKETRNKQESEVGAYNLVIIYIYIIYIYIIYAWYSISQKDRKVKPY